MYYHHSSSGDYFTLGNGANQTIEGYGTTLVPLGGKVVEKRNIFYVTGLSPPYNCFTSTVDSHIEATLGTTKVSMRGYTTSTSTLITG